MGKRGKKETAERFAQSGIKPDLEDVLRFATDGNDANLKHTDTVYESHDGKKILLIREFDKPTNTHREKPKSVTP